MSAFDLETAARALMPKEVLAQASSAHLALHISDGFVLVCVSDVASENPMWSQNFVLPSNDNLANGFEFIAARNWLEKVFRKVTLSFDTTVFTMIPEAFYDASTMEEVLRFNHPGLQGRSQQLELREADSRILFEWPNSADVVLHKVPHLRLMPLAFLMAKFAHHPQWNEPEQINLLVSDSRLIITATRQHRLLLLNVFEVSNETDVLYHLSNLAIRLTFDLERVPILLLQGPESLGLELLHTYCGNLRKSPFTTTVHPIIHLHSVCA
jgi:Protein of unknown function (DUF3822)